MPQSDDYKPGNGPFWAKRGRDCWWFHDDERLFHFFPSANYQDMQRAIDGLNAACRRWHRHMTRLADATFLEED